MAMKAQMTAKDYLASLNQWELEKVCSLTKHPDFAFFLAEPCRDVVKNATFAGVCDDAGVPSVYTNSPEAIHYLVIAIAKLVGNA